MREEGLFRAFVCCFFLLGATGQVPQPLALTILSLEVLGWGVQSASSHSAGLIGFEPPEDDFPSAKTSPTFLALVQNWPRQVLTAASMSCLMAGILQQRLSPCFPLLIALVLGLLVCGSDGEALFSRQPLSKAPL